MQYTYELSTLQDTSSKTQFTILTDRSHGGASLKDGSLEVMVCFSVAMCACLLYRVLSSVSVCNHITMYVTISPCM